MDVVLDNRFSSMYAFKLLRFLSSWVAIVIARKFFSDDYVNRTVVSGKRPRSLTSMILLFLGIQLCFDVMLLTSLMLAGNIRMKKGSTYTKVFPMLNSTDFLVSFCVDAIGTTCLSMGMCWIAASVVGSRVRFDYVTQGTRAARTLEEMMVNIVAISYLVPFFLIV